MIIYLIASSNIALSWAPESFDFDLEIRSIKAQICTFKVIIIDRDDNSKNLSNLKALMNCGSSSTVAILQDAASVWKLELPLPHKCQT